VDVLLLHGLGADRRAFQRFVRLLPESWRAEPVDLLGHGDNDHPESGVGLEDLADHAAGEVTRLRGEGTFGYDDPVAVVGQSYGAATGVAMAARHPELVARLVLLDPVVHLDTERDPDSRTAQMFQARRSGTLESRVPEIFPENGAALNSWVIDTWQSMSTGVLDEFDNDWPRFAPAVQCPVTIISGDVEHGGSGDAPAAAFGGRATLVRIAGAGHYLHATHARDTAQAVIDAVTSQDAGHDLG
jgi:pimeloyl-ACP methyl ester carboxylesterase